MKKFIHTITVKNQWLLNFTSSLAGTLLGIVLTFGVGAYIENQNQIQRSNKIFEYSLINIDENLMHLEQALKSQLREDSLLQVIHKSYNNPAIKVDADTLLIYLDELGKLVYDPFDNSAEPMFSNSIDIWPTEENEELITLIRDCFSIMRGAQKELDKCIEIRETFYAKTINDLANSDINNIEKITEILFNCEGYLHYATSLRNYIDLLSVFQEMVSENLDWAYEEFDKL